MSTPEARGRRVQSWTLPASVQYLRTALNKPTLRACIIFASLMFAFAGVAPTFAASNPPTTLSQNVFTYQNATPIVDGATGALTENIPLDMPPGRDGMQPDLSLDYNSQNTAQDSEVGYGWSLSIPYIERLNKTGTENMYGPDAYFTSSMDGELVAPPATAPASTTVTIYLWGGGGAGDAPGGAGGAGAFVTKTLAGITAGSYTVTVGTGGSPGLRGSPYTGGSGGTGYEPGGSGANGNSAAGVGGSSGGGSSAITIGGNTYKASGGGGGGIGHSGYGASGSSGGSGGAGGFVGNNNVGAGGGGGSGTAGANGSGASGGAGGSGGTTQTGTNGNGSGSGASSAGESGNGSNGNSLNTSVGANGSGGASGGAAGSSGNAGSGSNGTGEDSGGGGGGLPGGSGGAGEVIITATQGTVTATGGVHTTADGMDVWTFTSSGTFTISNIAASSSNTSTAYLALVDDGSYRQYTYATSTNSWTMYDKNGDEYLFGASSQSQQSATTSLTGTVQTYKWMLEEEIDPDGNYTRYVYSKDHNQIYPEEIIYTGHDGTDGPMTITFSTTTRPDTTINYLPGFEVDTDWLISQITIAVSSTTVRQYDLSYTTGNNGYRSLLSSIQESGWNSSGIETTLPPTSFGYVSTSTSFIEADPGNIGTGDPYVDTDVSGNGINAAAQIYCDDFTGTEDGYIEPGDEGGNNFTPPQVSSLCWAYGGGVGNDALNETGTRFVNINGSGKADIVQDLYNASSNTYTEGLYLNNGNETWTSTTTWSGVIPPFAETSSGGFLGTTGIFGNITGAGLPDYVANLSGGVSGTYLANGFGWTSTSTIFSAPESFPDNGTPDCTDSQLVDLTGDGLDDWVYTSGTDTYVLLNTGSGWESSPDSRWTISTSTVIASGDTCYDKGARFVDVNGDGLPDLVISYTNTNSNLPSGTYEAVYLNTGHGWATSTAYTIPYVIDGDGANVSYAGLANFMGDGQQDQDVLDTITYPKGGSTSVTYGYTTQSGTNKDLPYNLLVVTKVVNHNGEGSDEETDYSYGDGLQYLPSDVFDRKFAGFGVATTTNSESTVVTYYSQGATSSAIVAGDQSDGYGQINQPYRQDTFTPSGTLVQSIFYQYNPIWHGNSEFVGLTQQVEQDYASNGTHDDKATDYTYSTTTDALVQETDYGEVTGNSNGTFSTSTLSDPRTTDYTYAASGSINLVVPIEKTLFNSSGATTTDTKYLYDDLPFDQVDIGNQTEEEDLISTSTLTYASSTKAYNSYGLVASSTDRDGNVTTYSYDSFNLYPATTTNAHGQSTTYAYNYSNGQVATTTNPNGGITVTLYDGIGRQSEVEESDPSTPSTLDVKTTYQYVDSTTTPSSIEETDYLNAASSTATYDYYDGLDRLIQERKSTENSGVYAVTDNVYNTAGMLASTSLPYFSSGSENTAATSTDALFTDYAYDPLARVETAINAVGTTTNAYNGWTKTTTDPNGNVTDYISDAFGNLAQVVEHLTSSNATTTYAYDAVNNLTNITDAAGNIRNFTFDGLGDELSAQDLHNASDTTFGTWTYSYDPQSNLVSETDPDGHTITHTYDALNRVLTESLTGSGTQIAYTYDSCTDGIGELCSASSTGALDTYAYDLLGRTTDATTTIGGTGYGLVYGYDWQGDITSVTNNSDGSQVTYTYNGAELVSGVNRSSGATDSSIASLSNFAPTSQLGQIIFGSGASTTYSYNPAALYRLGRIYTVSTPVGTTTQLVLEELNYTYDADGNILTRTDSSDTGDGQVVTYTYDDLNRLLSASTTVSNVGSYDQTFTYDALGNVLTGPNGTYSYQGDTGSNYANPDAVTQAVLSLGGSSPTIGYDNSAIAGNGTPLSSLTFSYTTGASTKNDLMIVAVQEAPPTGSCSTDQVTGVTYNGASLTDAGYYVGNTSPVDGALKTYYGYAPATSTHNVVVSANAACILYATAATYSGVKQSAFPDASGTGNPLNDSGAVTTFQATTTTANNNAWAILIGVPSAGGTATAGANTTIRQQQSGNLYYADSNGPVSPAGSIGLNWTMGTSTHLLANYFSITPVTSYPGTVSTTTYSYDQNGNLISATTGATTTTYVYDYLNRLVALGATGAATTTYAYDAFGNRVSQTTGSTTTVYPNEYFSEITTSGATSTGTSTDYIFLPTGISQNNRLLATVDQPLVNGVPTGSSTIRYVHTDNLGSTQVTSDQNGNLAQNFDYAPYGSVLASTNTGATTAARQFEGLFSDPSGLIYSNARYYNPNQGQFLSEDPVFLDVGNPAEVQGLTGENTQRYLSDPQQLNSYSYSRDNPILNKDPSGNAFGADDLAGFGVGAVFGGGTYLASLPFTQQPFSWSDLAGSTITGGIVGWAAVNTPETLGASDALTASVLAGWDAGYYGNLTKQEIDIATGKQKGNLNYGDLAVSGITTAGTNGVLSALPLDAAIPGYSSGQGNMYATGQSMLTKQANGTISNISFSTGVKSAVGSQAVDLYRTVIGLLTQIVTQLSQNASQSNSNKK